MKALKVFVASAVAGAMPLCASAQLVTDMSHTDSQLSLPVEMNYTRTVNVLGDAVYTPQQVMPKDGETAVVTFQYAFKSATHAPMSINMYNPAVGNQIIDNTGAAKPYTFRIPVGTYDMHALFKGKPAGTYAVFKENVTITKDTTLVFNVDEAVHPFTFITYDEKGTQLTLNKYRGNEVVENGNCNSYRSYTFFALKGMGVIHTIVGGDYRVQGYDVDYYVNDVSDRFSVCHSCNMRSMANNAVYVFKFEKPMNRPGSYSNDPANLYDYTQGFVPTPLGENEPNSHIYAKRLWCSYEGKILLSAKDENKNIVLPDKKNRIFLDIPESDSTFNVSVSPMMGDIILSSGTVKFITGLPMCGNNATGIRSVDYGYETNFDGLVVPVGGGTGLVHPGNMALSWTQGQGRESYTYGNSCPMLSVKCKDYNGTSSKQLTYLGRYGEVYETDAVGYSSKKALDGNYTTYTYKMENASVDGMPAHNETILRYLTNGEDYSAPTIQMLRFVNCPLPSGMAAPAAVRCEEITDRGNSNSLVLEFTAGDLAYHHDVQVAANRYYACQPLANCEAYITKHGEEQWIPLNVTEVPEYYFMPGFGYFYRASMNKAPETGWYDLKIVLTDLAGNTQTQTLAPAACITSTEIHGIPGDVNHDGVVDVTDANITINVVLAPSSIGNYPAADVNHDGIVDVTDLNMIINILLNK